MAREVINVGSLANDGTGDPFRNVCIKINNMTSEIYTAIGDGTLIEQVANITGTPANNQLAVWADSSTVEGDAGLTWDGTALSVTGNIIVTGTVDGIDLATRGDTFKVGVPVNNQIGVWTGDGTIEGDAGLTWDGIELAVSGDILAGGLVGGANLKTSGGVYLFVDPTTGVTDPIDPLGAGDPFDTIESVFVWVEKNYVGLHLLEIDLNAETHTFSGPIYFPSNITRLVFYGASTVTTFIDMAGGSTWTGTGNQSVELYSLTINNLSNIIAGTAFVSGVDINQPTTSGSFMLSGNPLVGASFSYNGSVFQNVTITRTTVNGGITSNQVIQIDGGTVLFDLGFTYTIDNTNTTNGTNGGDIIKVEGGGSLIIADTATFDVQDQFGGSGIPGNVVIENGSSLIIRAGATITNGNFVTNDTTGIVYSDLRANILSVATSRTLALTDERDILEVDTTGGAVALTISPDATTDFPIGTKIEVTLIDATAAATVVADTGVTLNGVLASTETIVSAAYSHITLYKRAADNWVVYGDVV